VAEEQNRILELLNRRSFIKRAGAFAAACMFCGTMTNCADNGIDIPCLGPADPPVPVPGMTYIRASEIGCALDCDLRTGRNKHTGGPPTDDAPKINAAMAAASATNPITLIIDGSALVSGLFMPAEGHWAIAGLGCGTGFFLKDGANNDAIHNGPANAAIPFDPGPPAPARGSNVSLSNFTVNGNQYRVSTLGSKQGANGIVWFCGINLMNLDDVTIENVVVVNTPAYHIRLSNVGNVSVSGCVLQSRGASTDGLHINGPANDIKIANCRFKTDDDSIALNCPEGYTGDISRITVTGCEFNSWSLMRMYTTNGSPAKFRIDSVLVENCTGTLAEAAFLIGVAAGSVPKSIGTLRISNCVFTAPAVLGIAENFGNIVLQDVAFIPFQSQVVWKSPQANETSAFARPSPLYGAVPFIGLSLAFQNCRIYRPQSVDVAAIILENQSSIHRIEFDGFALQNARPYSPVPSLVNLEGGSVGELVFNALDSTNIESPVEAAEFSDIGTISGAGVLETGWKFPDAVMADGVPYISTTTGRASIKVGGSAELYP